MALDLGLDVIPLIISEVWIIYSITAMKRFLRKYPNETTTKIIGNFYFSLNLVRRNEVVPSCIDFGLHSVSYYEDSPVFLA
jgi:hypothetical protein